MKVRPILHRMYFSRNCYRNVCLLLLAFFMVETGFSQVKRERRAQSSFKWVNKKAYMNTPGVLHRTFRSPSMNVNVGYYIYLPLAYEREQKRRFPVVYYLHGGRPGSEAKAVKLAEYIHANQSSPVIYVFVNGGPVSHYNLPDRENAMGEDVFITELIPHIDDAYRTIGNRSGRGLEGFSQGGRGTARIMFKHPHLFCSAAPGGGGFETEKRISEENGRESAGLVFAPGYNAWDLARSYAETEVPSLRRLIFVGTEGFNYENNLAYMKFLESLGIPFERLIVEGVGHNAVAIYEKCGKEIMNFHAESFKQAERDR